MKEIINFVKKNSEYYKDYLINNRLTKCKYGYTCDINQIYCYLKKIDIKKTEYYNFYKISQKYFNFKDKKILEVACGYIPILSSLYRFEDIDITAINNKILINNYMNIKTIEYDLQKEINLQEYDIIIGLRPCNITENIIDCCYKYKKDFIIYLCPCIHEPKDQSIITSYKEWINYLKKKLYQYKDYSINFFMDKNMPDDCPIIIGNYLKN